MPTVKTSMPFLGNRKSISDRKDDPPEEAVDAPGLETWTPDKGMARGRSRVSALGSGMMSDCR